MLSNHWKIDETVLETIKIENLKGYSKNKTNGRLSFQNKELIPSWADKNEEPNLIINGFSDKPSNQSDCEFISDSKTISLIDNSEGIVLNNVEQIINDLLKENYIHHKQPITSKLPFSYRNIHPTIRNIIYKQVFQRIFKLKESRRFKFPAWPVEKSVELLRYAFMKSVQINAGAEIPHVSFWPEKKKFSIILTHDMETAASFKNIEAVREVEREHGFVSSWYVLSKKYDLTPKRREALSELEKEGCEIGLHGFSHDGKMPFLSKDAMHKRMMHGFSSFNDLNIKGYRSAQLMRSPDFLENISKYFAYDTSVPDTDFDAVVGDRKGCCSVFPFFINGMVELPLTIVNDFGLIYSLKYKEKEVLENWKNKIEHVRKVGGTAVFLTHPEDYLLGTEEYLGYYDKILKYLSKFESGWNALPKDAAEWWVERDRCKLKNEKISGSNRATVEYFE